MLKFVSLYLALSYLVLATLTVAGLLQVLAAWRSIVGLALLDYRRRPAWRWGLGPLLIAGAYVWFFGTRREILTPGPAGAELTVLFGGGVLAALALTLGVASLARPFRQRPAPCGEPEPSEIGLEGGCRATLFVCADQGEPGPGICLLPDPALGAAQVAGLAAVLAAQSATVLVPIWGKPLGRADQSLAVVAAGLDELARRPSVDPSRLALVGANLGADLALRAAAGDERVRTVVALAPEIVERNGRAGLGLLQEITYVEAIRWNLAGRRRRWLRALQVPEAAGRLGARPVLAVYGREDAVVSLPEAQAGLVGANPGLLVLLQAGVGHLSLVGAPGTPAIIWRWLADHLPESGEGTASSPLRLGAGEASQGGRT